MPTVCVNDCAFTVQDGQLDLAWSAVGAKRVCQTGAAYQSNGGNGHPEWSGMRTVNAQWRNTTCHTHRAIARMDVPWVRMILGTGNSWFVRGDLEGSIDALPVIDYADTTDMQWASSWSSFMPDASTISSSAPGGTEHEYLVPPGSTLYVTGHLAVQTPSFTTRPGNLLSAGPVRVSITAWPADVDTGSGLSC